MVGGMVEHGARLPLTAAQEGIWLGQQLDPRAPCYNAAQSVELAASVDAELLARAVRLAVDETEALHVVFEGSDGGVVQRPRAPAWDLEWIDLGAMTEPDAEAEVSRWIEADLHRVADLDQGPLFTQALLRLPDERILWYQRVHHIALDGFGFALLSRRVAAIYTALASGRIPEPADRSGLAAVIEEDQAYRRSEARQRDREFWLARLEGAVVPPTLGRCEPGSLRFPRRQVATLSADTMARLRAAAQPVGGTWADAIVALVAGYVAEVTGVHDVVLGVPMMDRMGSPSARVPSMRMNIVPLRLAVDPVASLHAGIDAAAQELRRCRPHARYRYEALRRDLGRVGGMRRLFGPVVNVMPFGEDLAFARGRGRVHPVSAGPVEDLSIGLRPGPAPGTLRVELDAHPEAYGDEDVRAHLEGWMARLDRASREPGSPGPARVVSRAWVGEPLATPAVDVLARLTGLARARPHAVALVSDAGELSFAALDRRVRALAGTLLEAGGGAGGLVAIFLPRSEAAIVALLAALGAGAAYLPLDPEGPPRRNAAILDEARPRIVVTRSDLLDRLEVGDARVILVDRDEATAPAVDLVMAAEDRLAYVLYTSGSTGRPNGVEIGRAALSHFVAAAIQRYGITADDRVLQFAPLHFDASVEEVFVTLGLGATLVLRSEPMLESMGRFVEACATQAITVLDLPTAFWHELAYAISEGLVALPTCVRIVILGGEAVSPERLARWRRCVPPEVALLNTYGPTETTVVATCAALHDRPADEPVTIGAPLPGVTALVLDEHQRPVPAGREGELYLCGPTLAEGYLGQPDLDAARFVLLRHLAGAPRAYRTGDRVRAERVGLAFLGRVDDELKLSGQRIDPRSIESVLLEHPGVREAAVVVVHGTEGGSATLHAHVVADDPDLREEALRRHAAATLLPVAVPSRITLLDRLPRTPSGKIDRRALATRTAERRATEGPVTAMEAVILETWAEVLGARDLEVDSDFFARGGHSLQVLQVGARLQSRLGRDVPASLVFQHPTARTLARALAGELGGGEARADPLFRADGELPADVRPRWHGPSAEPGAVLLTGATGFVGAHLLAELARTEAAIVCLVRAPDRRAAEHRLRATLARYGLTVPDLDRRVVVFAADLEAPRLGLGPAELAHLHERCHAIFHAAAVVSLARSYASLRQVNVLAVRELLRVATTGRRKAFHLISSVAVGPRLGVAPETPEDFVSFHHGLVDGYGQSKWQAEQLVRQAAERGVTVRVCRLPRVVGASSTGYVSRDDLFWRIARAAVLVGARPDLDVVEHWLPVDRAARAVVALGQGDRAAAAVYNVVPAAAVAWSSVWRSFEKFGYHLPPVPWKDWHHRLTGLEEAADRATAAMLQVQASATTSDAPAGLAPIARAKLLLALPEAASVLPVVGDADLRCALDYAVRHGILPPPRR